MSLVAVARKDFRDAIRSQWLLALSALFVVAFAGPSLLKYTGAVGLVIQLMKSGTAVLVPIIAIVVSYASITREQESGTLKLLLGLPHSRADVVVGKLLGRSAVVALPIIFGFVIASIILLPGTSFTAVARFASFALLTVLLGVVFVGISIGISAAASTDRQAVVGSVTVFLAGSVFWGPLVGRVASGLEKYLGMTSQSKYLVELFLKLLNPIAAYETLVDSTLGMSQIAARQQLFGFFIIPDPAAQKALGDELPVIFTDPFVVVYLLLWFIIPVFIGMEVFERADL